MVAQVFSFFQARSAKAEAKSAAGDDWSVQEIAEFYRVEASLIQAGMSVAVDRGVTDEGDPWFVFCRPSDGEVIIHFARIGGNYLIVSEATGQTLTGPDFRLLLAEFAAINPTLVPLRAAKHSAKLMIHPAALLAAVVAAAFFQVSGSEAVASELKPEAVDGRGADGHGQRHSSAGTDTERHLTDRQIVAAMAAMIGLVALDFAPELQQATSELAGTMLDVASDLFNAPKLATSPVVLAEHGAEPVRGNDLFSLDFTHQPDFAPTAAAAPTTVAGHGDMVVAAATLETATSATSSATPRDAAVFAMTDGIDRVDAPVAWADPFAAVPVPVKYADAGKVGTASSPAPAVAAKESAPTGSSSTVDRATVTDKGNQVASTSAMDVISGDLSAANRSANVTVLASNLSVHDVLDFAANQVLGQSAANGVLRLMDPLTGTGKIDPSLIAPIAAINTVASLSLSESLTPSSVSFMPHRDDAFDSNAEAVLKAFLRQNTFEIFTSGRDVVILDTNPDHFADFSAGSGFVNKSWSMNDGTTIMIIGHLSYGDGLHV